jgi:hypothetical protein
MALCAGTIEAEQRGRVKKSIAMLRIPKRKETAGGKGTNAQGD